MSCHIGLLLLTSIDCKNTLVLLKTHVNQEAVLKHLHFCILILGLVACDPSLGLHLGLEIKWQNGNINRHVNLEENC